MGEITQRWKQFIMQKEFIFSKSITNFLNTMAGRTLLMFKYDSSSEGTNINRPKDYIGLNLINAVTLFNCTLSHIELKSSDFSQ
jgi:hypothetical protein